MPFSTEALSIACDERDRVQSRFWTKVRKTSKCWLWAACKTRAGYGQFWFRGIHRTAHRIAYALLVDDVPDGMVVCHSCDVPGCVRPDHLFLGTQAENIQDSEEKGRRVKGMLGRVGELCPAAKLNDANVVEIRNRYAVGNVTQAQLADEFGIHRVQMNKILNRKIWKHV